MLTLFVSILENTEFEKKIDYQTTLNNSYISSNELNRYPTPQSLKGYINLVEDTDYDDLTMQYKNEIDAGYFISNDDWFEIDTTSDGMRETLTIDLENYEIDGDIITFTETLNEYYGYGGNDISLLFFNDQFSYLSLDLEDPNDGMGMYSESDYDNDDIEYGVIYPAYLDLDNDGLADGEGMKAQIAPNFDRLPTSSEIQTAIDNYNQSANSDNNNNEIGESSNDNQINSNALTDADGDNMPDALEIQYGGDSSDPNDASTTLNEILLVDRYTLSEITDLRLGSTLYEVSQGIVSFNIVLEESTDLVNWVQHEPMQIDLGQQSDDNSKFYRFKMND